MKTLVSTLLLLLFLGTSLQGFAQDTLSLGEAIQLALQNNYGIKASRNDLLASQNNATRGQANYFPSFDLSSGANISNANSTVGFAVRDENGDNVIDPNTGKLVSREVTVPGITTWNANAGLNMTYTVFDGFGRKANYEILQATVGQSQAQVRNLVENTLSQVANAYYQLARTENTYRIQQEAVEVSQTRLQRARTQLDFGSGSRLLVLNAEVDLNADSVALAQSALSLQNARRNLLALLAGDLDRDFRVETQVEFSETRSLEALFRKAMAQNSSLQLAEKAEKLAELNLQVAEAARFPRLDINGSYSYRYADNGPVSFLLTSENLSLNAGASLNFNIFNGRQTATRIENAQLSVLSSQLRKEEAQKNLERDLLNALANYQNSLDVLALQQKSLEAARLNFEQTQEQYRLGQANSTQFREAQLNLIRVRNQLNDLRYDTKLFEIELQRLTGELGGE
jgi:outer membrane protein